MGCDDGASNTIFFFFFFFFVFFSLFKRVGCQLRGCCCR
jgi:hypothetical protein